MSSIENTKAFAAILTAGIAFSMSGFIASLIVHPTMPHQSAIQIGEAAGGAAPTAPAAPTLEPVGVILANASVERGQQLTQRLCAACHTLNEGGRSGVGPNLYGIIGAKHAHVDGFNYSAAIRGKPGPWTYEDMNRWLAKPSEYAPGNRMAFAGVSNAQQRGDIIAYLRSISPNAPPPPAAEAPAPQPTPAAAATPAPAAAAAPQGPTLASLLANADVANGERVARQQCGVCHTFNEGGRNGVGPNLYDTVGKPHGHLASFNYSAVLKGKQGPWTYEALDAWLAAPMQYAPGTRMAFAGIRDPKVRADVIAYMRSLSANPVPLP
jgi:cytochrome c